MAGLTALAATLTIGIAIVSTVAAIVSIRQLDRTTRAERESRMALGNSLLTEGAALEHTGMIGQRFDSLDRLARAARVLAGDRESPDRLPEIRRHATAALGLTDMRVLWKRNHGSIYSFSVDTAFERYAVADRSAGVVVYRLDDQRELFRVPPTKEPGVWHAETIFSPDGELLVVVYVGADGGNLLHVWQLGRHELVASLLSQGGATAFYGGVFSPDSRRLLFCPPEGGIAVWDRGERRVVRRLPVDFAPQYLAIDPEGKRVACNNLDGPPRVWIIELESGRVVADWKSHVGPANLAWSGDGQLLAVGSYAHDSPVYVWNVPRDELAAVLQGHNSNIINARFARDGYLLATTSWDVMTLLWDAASGELLVSAPGQMLGFAPDGKRLAFRSGGTIGVWEVAAGDACRTLHPGMLGNRSDGRRASVVSAGAFTPDGRLLVTTDVDGARFWEADTGREVAHLENGARGNALFHPEGQSLIITGESGLYRWPIRPDPERGADAIRIGPPELLRETASSWDQASWLPDHRTLALTDNTRARILLVDSIHPHPAWSHAPALDSGENQRMMSVVASPDGRWLAVGGWKQMGVRVWDLKRRKLERLMRPDDAVGDTTYVVSFSPDSRFLISNTSYDWGRRYHFWRTGTWDLRQEIASTGVACAALFTGNGQLMALGLSVEHVLLNDVASGRDVVQVSTLKSGGPAPLAFSPDATRLAAATQQRTVLLWDLRRLREKLVPLGLDWEAPSYPPSLTSAAATAVRPPRSVRIVGEVLEPQIRRKAERATMDRRLAADPFDAEALIHRGWLSLSEQKPTESSDDLDRAHRLEPANPDVDWMLVQAYQDADNLWDAWRVLSRILERAADDQDARFERGLLALALGLAQQAVDDFDRIVAVDSKHDHARYHRARALISLARYRDAMNDLDALIAIKAEEFGAYELRAAAHDAIGDSEKARLDRAKAQSLLSNNSSPLNERAWVLATGPRARRDPLQAIAMARRAVALAADQALYLNTLGVALYRAGQYAEALVVLEQSLLRSEGKFDGFDLFFLAMAHHRLGHPGLARQCFDGAVRWWDLKKVLKPPHIQDLTAFRAESEALLAGRGDELPADVFAPL